MSAPSGNSRYVVKSIVHAAQVMSAFQSEDESLRLRDVAARTGLNKVMCFRLLYTLHLCGFLEKVGENQYRATSPARAPGTARIGCATRGPHDSFGREVEAGLIRAAGASQVQLVMLDNRRDAKTALRNAEQMVEQKVDLAIEFHLDDSTAPAIAGKFLEANIPFIAVDSPHPGATYFGANHYEAGRIGGRHLGRWANRYWEGECEEIVMLEIANAGSGPQARMRGMLAGVQETIRGIRQRRAILLNGEGLFRPSLECVRKHLRTSRSRRTLLGAATDPSALGALRAFEEAGGAVNCAIVGHNADPEGRAQLRETRTKLIGSVAYFPEKYGEGIIRLALDILSRKPTPPAVFTQHKLITPENVDQFYPPNIEQTAAGA